MKKISKSNSYIKIITIIGVAIWLIENIFLIKMEESEKYFNVIASIILFVISIYSLTTNLNKNYKSFFKEANIVIIITLSTVMIINIRENYLENRRSDVEAIALEEVEMEVLSENGTKV